MELLVDKAEAIRVLEDRADLGCSIRELSDIPPRLVADWCKTNRDVISRLFKPSDVYDQYLVECPAWVFKSPAETGDSYETVRKQVHDLVEFLYAKADELHFLVITPKPPKVFVVHGRDGWAEVAVEALLRKLDLMPIILHRVAGAGSTIIELLEEHSNVDFAVVLLTPDDRGYLAEEPGNAMARARQNVVLELGYFVGKVGRARVCVLAKSGIELPSDILGVKYVSLDDGGWELELAKSMVAANMDVDTRRLL